MNYFNYQNDQLHVEGFPLNKLAEQYGTPTYIYSKQAIVDAFLAFKLAFSQHPHKICYSVKANSNLGVLSLLESLGAHFDIVSGGELERVLCVGASGDRVVFSGVGKQGWEIEQALKANIACFNIESSQELLLIEEIAAGLKQRAPIAIRVNPGVDAYTHPYISTGLKQNKFGVAADTALELYLKAARSSHVKVVGIDYHLGSQILTPEPFIDALQKVLALIDTLHNQGITLEHINLGGGVGISYEYEEALNLETYASAILQTLGRYPHTLLFEPGRYIVGSAGILLCRVILLKENTGKHFAVVDAAMNDLIRPALYQSWHKVQAIQKSATAPLQNYDIVGPICETSDFLSKNQTLAIASNDLLAIHSAGAYGFTMSSNYNSRGRAAELIIDDETVHEVRQRETILDQIRLEQRISL